MLRGLAVLILVGAITLAGAASAEARVFTPQPRWWSSGETCAATRNPPGRRWRALPPRTCTAVAPEAIAVAPPQPVSFPFLALAPLAEEIALKQVWPPLQPLPPVAPLDWGDSPA
jgi:hypothetical protein